MTTSRCSTALLIILLIKFIYGHYVQEVPNWLEKEANENPLGFFGIHGARFSAPKDIRTPDSFLPSGNKPTEHDIGWN